jgi:hypothetical protein
MLIGRRRRIYVSIRRWELREKLREKKKVHSARDKEYDVVPWRVNIYDFLLKILKEIAQNLQHGSIF